LVMIFLRLTVYFSSLCKYTESRLISFAKKKENE